MRLLLVRHAEAHDELVQGRSADPRLTALGEAQAQSVARVLRTEAISAIYSSPARRALATAKPLAKQTGLRIRKQAALREFNHGSGEYLSVEEMRRRGDPRWDALQRGELYDCSMSAADLRKKITRAMDRIVSRHAGETVAIFTHAGAINLYIGGIVGSQKAIWTAPGNAGISSVLADRRGRRMLLSLNEMSHVRELVTAAAQRPGPTGQTVPWQARVVPYL